jgi:hypothetical protein
MRVNLSIIMPWLLGKLSEWYTWKIWLLHWYHRPGDCGLRFVGLHVQATKNVAWSGISFSINL